MLVEMDECLVFSCWSIFFPKHIFHWTLRLSADIHVHIELPSALRHFVSAMYSLATRAQNMQIQIIPIIPHQRYLYLSRFRSFSVQSLFKVFLCLIIDINCFNIRMALEIYLHLPLSLHGLHLLLSCLLLLYSGKTFFFLELLEPFFLFFALPFHAFLECL